MARTTLRSRWRQHDVETLGDLHAALVRERQQLRTHGAESEELERNRLAIVDCQWKLSRALIARHLPPSPASSPA